MSEASATNQQAADGRADFDFFVGTWHVRNRRLQRVLAESAEWEEFPATTVARKTLGGLGNVDEISLTMASGRREGMTVRLFDPELCLWRLYWVDSRQGTVQAPMIGKFTDGRGEFYGQESIEDRGVYCRYIWSDISATSCRWEQAFSVDGGRTWETNWVMEFTR